MTSYAADWLNLLLRWFHFTAGVAWIGTSLYFVWLDDQLTAPPAQESARGVSGELWSVHGGGFYHNQKYPLGPRDAPLPTHLHWFKWEAYTTWLSGIAMLALMYWAGARTYLVDATVLDITPTAAIAASIASLVAGWFVYDALCRALRSRPRELAVVLYAGCVAAAYGLFHLFGGRAAYIHVGAILGTIMAANVLFVIIPAQAKMVAALRGGLPVDPNPGRTAKTRSLHNTYLTLPVLFIMISNHYPITYAQRYGWADLALLGLAGVLVRHFFILTHTGRYVIALPLAAAVLIAAPAFAFAPRLPSSAGNSPVAFAQVAPIFAQRCAPCHAAHPARAGFSAPPAGIRFDTPALIATNAPAAYTQAVTSQAMPLGNVTGMRPAERMLIGRWFAQGAKLK